MGRVGSDFLICGGSVMRRVGLGPWAGGSGRVS